jgi:hypothetical protein
MKTTRSEKRGTARMIEQGNRPLQLWLSPFLHDKLQRVAKEHNQTMAGYAMEQLRDALANDRIQDHKARNT